MKLFDFQNEAVDQLDRFLANYRKIRDLKALPLSAAQAAWAETVIDAANVYVPLVDSEGTSIPCACVAIPTGGGKTLTALAAVKRANDHLHDGENFIVWTVPSKPIFDQTHRNLSIGGYLAEFARSELHSNLIVKTLEDPWSDSDLDGDSFTVLLTTQQALAGNDDRRFKRASGVSGLSLWGENDDLPSVENLMRRLKPVFVVDEAHRTYAKGGRQFFKDNSYASCVIEFTATPKAYEEGSQPNIIYKVGAAQLIANELIKHPLIVHTEPNLDRNGLLEKVVRHREHLERDLFSDNNYRVKPKVLLSCRRTGPDHAEDPLSVQSLRALLLDLGIDESAIAIESSTQDDLTGVDIDDRFCPVEFVLTKTKLMEGWDAKSVFFIVLLNEISATQSTFQIVGRGLRQPEVKYFEQKELNRVHVYSNLAKQEEVLRSLLGYLDECGLGDIPMEGPPGIDRHSFKLDQSSIRLPQISLWADDRQMEAAIIRRATSEPPPLLSPEDLIQAVGQIDSEIATVDLTGANRTPFQQGSSRSRNPEAPTPWKEAVMMWGLRAVAGCFEDSYYAINWLQAECDLVLSGSRSDEIRQILPKRAVGAIASHVHTHLALKRHEIVLEQLDRARVEATPLGVRDILIEKAPKHLRTFQNCIPDDTPPSPTLFNEAELDFAFNLDGLGYKWLRNWPGSGGYELPGGQHMRFFPDFIALADESSPGAFDRVVLIETKGDHLVGSLDYQKKEEVCAAVTRVAEGQITAIVTNYDEALQKVQRALECQGATL